ncbi:hypothetical protein ACFVXQ_34920 [Kitasatospora sp. NPDC058263]
MKGNLGRCTGYRAIEDSVRGVRHGEEPCAFRRYRLPAYADVPRTAVHFAETSDPIDPLGAQSMSESSFNPVPPAFPNALRDATGIRFTEAPFLWEKVGQALAEHRAGSRRPPHG